MLSFNRGALTDEGKYLEGELVDLIEDFSEGKVQFSFLKVKDPNTTLPKYVLIGWVSSATSLVV